MPGLPPKKDVMLALLEKASVFVHLDPRVEGVSVPPWLAKQPDLVLQLGLQMAVQIPDLEVDDDGVFATLSFNRSPHYCRVPWNAVYALVGEDGRGMMWPEDIPPEVAARASSERAKQKKPALRAVPGGADDEEVSEKTDAGSPAGPAAEPARAEPAPAEEKPAARGPRLALARDDSDSEEGSAATKATEDAPEGEQKPQKDDASTSGDRDKPKRPPHLRLVK